MTWRETLISFTIAHEGGFVNNPNDSGGTTMKGVTLATYRRYRADMGLPAPTVNDLKNITVAEWENIFDRYYWNAVKASQVSNQRNACVLADWAWMSGVSSSIKSFQKFAGIKQDSIVGTQTINALNSADFWALCNYRENFYYNIVNKTPSEKVFLNGWLNRLNDFRTTFGVGLPQDDGVKKKSEEAGGLGFILIGGLILLAILGKNE